MYAAFALAMMLAAVWLLLPQAFAAEAFVQQADPLQAWRLLKQADHLHVVDLRARHDFLQGTLPGAVHLDWDGLLQLKPEPAATLLLIQGKAMIQPEVLQGRYHRVYILDGGIEAWRRAGFTLVRPKQTKPAFVIPRGLCEMNEPAMQYPAEAKPEEVR